MLDVIAISRRPLILLATTLSFLLVGTAPAADDRPQEMPYESLSDIPQLSPDYGLSTHVVVLITDNGLNPQIATLDADQLVAWISYSAEASVVVFEREVARNMVCHDLVNFSFRDDELRSAKINAGEFASFCRLKPGRYKYMVKREGLKSSGSDAAARLQGEIIVRNADDAK